MKKEDLDALAGLYEGVYSPAETGEYLSEEYLEENPKYRTPANDLLDAIGRGFKGIPGALTKPRPGLDSAMNKPRGINKPATKPAKPSALAGRVSSTTDIAALRRGQEQARKDQLAKASKASEAPKPAPPGAGAPAAAKVAPTAAAKPAGQTGDKAKDMATWAKANPTLANKPKTPNPLMQKTFGYQKGGAPDQVAKTAAATTKAASNLSGTGALATKPPTTSTPTSKPAATLPAKRPSGPGTGAMTRGGASGDIGPNARTIRSSYEWGSKATLKDVASLYSSIYEGKKKDQDQDGDNDFADVRIARMIASGMSKAEAIAAVKNKEYNEEFELDEAAKRTPRKTRGVKPSDKEWQKGRSDAGKRISGDEDTGPRHYTLGRARGAAVDAPTPPGAKPKNTPKLAGWEKDDIQYRKGNLKAGKTHKVGGEKGLPEEYQIYEIVASYLLENNFAETINDANAIIENMSETWLEEILTEKSGEQPLPYGRMMKKSDELADSDDPKKQKRAADIYLAANAPKGPKIRRRK